jgi:hypothetical protein
MSIALGRIQSAAAAHAARARAEEALAVLERARPIEAVVVKAEMLIADGRLAEAGAALDTLVDGAPPGFACWMLPVEPLLAQLALHQSFAGALGRLADRAR